MTDTILIDMKGRSSISELSDEELVFGLLETHDGKVLFTNYLKEVDDGKTR